MPMPMPVPGRGWVRPAVATGGLGLGGKFSLSAALLSGCEIPGIGFIDADTVQALLNVVPTDIGRALLDARTGTLMETVTTAYRPSKNLTEFVTTRDGTCRMWGCPRPAVKCDIDHARPWPTGPTTPTNLGGLCRRHHRLKQQRRWTYQLAPDGTATWTSPTGTQTHHAARPRRPPTTTTATPDTGDPRGARTRPRRRRASPVLTDPPGERPCASPAGTPSPRADLGTHHASDRVIAPGTAGLGASRMADLRLRRARHRRAGPRRPRRPLHPGEVNPQ